MSNVDLSKADFSGWATRANLKCSDGRIIRDGAFKHNDGKRVPLVWNHQYDDVKNILGYAILQHREGGMYAYGFFNDTEEGQDAKARVDHGDILSLSIFANRLKQQGPNVEHGDIKEVSLVLASANPGAFIEDVLSHDDESGESAVIYTGEEFELRHADEKTVNDVFESFTDEQRAAFNALVARILGDEDGGEFKHADGKTIGEVWDTFTKEQEAVATALIAAIMAKADGEDVKHSDTSEEETVNDVLATLDEKQTQVVNYLIGKALEQANDEDGELNHSDEESDDETIADVLDTLTDKQRNAVNYLFGKMLELKHSDEEIQNEESEGGDNNMSLNHNLFEQTGEQRQSNTLSHSDMETIVKDAKRLGSMREAFNEFLSHADTDIEYSPGTATYGVDGADNFLFPEAHNLNTTPEFIKREMGWVQKLMRGVHHTPFSRIKSMFADITADDARAKGYIKGKLKKEEVFTLLKRTTTPTTIYKKQKLDRDDVIDIVDMDVIAWIKGEMRMMLDEEIARAILVGDGRLSSSDDKINELNIRPIWKDADLFTIKKMVEPAGNDPADLVKAWIRAAIKARKDYKGTGSPTLFTTDDMLTEALLMEDTMGHIIYDSVEKLATALRVKEIVTVPVLEGLTRENEEGKTVELLGIIVNPADYNVGADKGGAINMFDDFDIDYNQMKYLIETRCSGALIKPFSAIALEVEKTV